MLKLISANNKISEKNSEIAKNSLDQLLARQDLGFLQLHQRDAIWDNARKIGQEISEHYSELVLIGIGGSSLGPKIFRDLFQSSDQKFHVLDNVDSMLIDRLLDQIKDLKKTAWLIVSKSGSTLETLAITQYVSEAYQKRNIFFHSNTYIVSELRLNPLTEWAKLHKRPVLEIPVDVGGRFSIFSSVGLVPLAFLGVSLTETKAGMIRAFENRSLIQELTAHYLESFQRGEWITVFFIYSSLLKHFGGWWQQLWAESLAKKSNRNNAAAARVSTPFVAIGACDQHSVLQQFMDGYQDKFFTFLRIQDNEKVQNPFGPAQFNFKPNLTDKSLGQILAAEAESTEKALINTGASAICLQMHDLSPQSTSELLMIWQIVTGSLGEALNINAFDQPGVEISKKIARDLLSR